MQQAAAVAALFCKGVCFGSDAETIKVSCRMSLIYAVFQRVAACNGGKARLMPLSYITYLEDITDR